MSEQNDHKRFDPCKNKSKRGGCWKSLLDFSSVIQVHCYLWSYPTLCSPHCAWEMEGSLWPPRDASSVLGSVCTRDKSVCGCTPWRPGPPPVPVCGRGARVDPCPRIVCHCRGLQRRPVLDAPPRAKVAGAAWTPPAAASPASCHGRARSRGALAASPHTLTAACTHRKERNRAKGIREGEKWPDNSLTD